MKIKKNISLNLAVLKNLSNVQTTTVKGGISAGCFDNSVAKTTALCI